MTPRIDRSGREHDTVGAFTYVGILAGFLAPALLVALLIAGDIVEPTFSQLHSDMSELGEPEGGIGLAFELIHYVTAVLLGLFTAAVWKLIPSSRYIDVLLVVIVIFTFALAQARRGDGRPPTIELVEVLYDAHGLVAGVLGASIIGVLLIAAIDLRSTGPYRWLKFGSLPALLLAVAATATYMYLRSKFASGESGSYRGLAERLVWVAGYGWVITASVLMLRFGRMRSLRPYDVTRLQPNIVYGSNAWQSASYQILDIDDAEGFRLWLGDALASDLIRSEETRPLRQGGHDRGFAVTLALSRKGLEHLGIDYRWRTGAIDDAFGAGMAERFELLGDDPETPAWDRSHVLVWVTAKNEAALRSAEAAIGKGLDPVTRRKERLRANVRDGPGNTEPFGFVDGISNPWIRGVHDPADLSRAGGGKVTDRGFQQLALGEFVLGELDETDDVMPVPEPVDLFTDGTFLVIRKIEQDTAAFERLADQLGRSAALGEDVANGKIVGRAKDGTPLATTTDRFGSYDNHFLYGDDPEGMKCPIGAHVRRANPRDSLGFDGVLVHRRRIIRRGMPYREGETEGLMFVCVNARPADQFEFIQRVWLNDGDAIRLGYSPDPVAGSWSDGGLRTVVVPTDSGPTIAKLHRPLVTTRGGGYFFVPSMSGLHYLTRRGPLGRSEA